MKRIALIAVLMTLLLTVAQTVAAQDDTPDPDPAPALTTRTYPADNFTITPDGTPAWENFTFEATTGAEWYGIWIGAADYSQQALYRWYPATDASPGASAGQGICTGTTCSLPDEVWVANGRYRWWLTTWSSASPDYQNNWTETTFRVEFPAPGAIQRTAPGTTLPDMLQWDYDPNVLWYRVWAGDDPYVGRGIYPGAQGWLAAQDICDATTCTLDVSAFDFTPGDYQWWMEAWGPGGYTTWTTNGVLNFTVDDAAAAPAVVSTTPTDTATAAPINTNVSVTFSKPVTAAGAFALTCDGAPVSLSPTTADDITFALNNAALPYGVSCIGTVTATAVSDLDTDDPPDNMAADYTFSFTTAFDPAPTVVSTTPSDNAVDVPVTSDLTVTFSEPVTAASGAFALTCDAAPQTITPATSDDTTFTLSPAALLPYGASCTLTVTAANVTDLDANDPFDAMQADVTVTFTTVAGVLALAVDDTVSVANGGTNSADILSNDQGMLPLAVLTFGDSLANVGTTPADGTVASFAAPGGGTLDVSIVANGTLDVASNGTTGTGTVSVFYQMQASDTSTDIGQIDITYGDLPTAADDTLTTLGAGNEYSTEVNVDLNVSAGIGTLNNDTLGIPAATLTLWGGGDASASADNAPGAARPLAGGTLTVNADGSFDLVNPTMPGTYTFDYIIDNGLGTSQATVEIYVNQAPTAVADSISVVLGTTDASNNVTTNDDLGAPPAVVDFYADTGDIGGASQVAAPGVYTHPTGGFAVTIAANGALTVDASVGGVTAGIYTFDYQITNAAGSSVATVTVEIQAGPTAVNDAYTFLFDVDQNVVAGTGLFVDNGSGADDLGVPTATITSFGGGDLSAAVTDHAAGTPVSFVGGTLTVNTDGSWTLTGQPFTPGQYTFDYRLTNAAGTADATVTLNIQAPPTAVDDDPAGVVAYDVLAGTTTSFTGVDSVRNRNDDWTLPNVVPDATVTRYADVAGLGGASEATVGNPYTNSGVEVTIQANGDITIDTTGISADVTIQLEYELANAAGTDTAIVTIRANALPTVTQSEVEENAPTFIPLPEQGVSPAPTSNDNPDIDFVFSEAVTFNPGAFSVVCGTSGNVTGQYTPTATFPATIVRLAHSGAPLLTPGETCTVTLVSPAILDTDGNPLDGNANGAADGSPADDEVYDFVVDTLPSLTEVAVEVANTYTTVPGPFPTGVTNTDTDTTIRLTFDEPVNDFGGTTVTCTVSGSVSSNGGGLSTAGNGSTVLTLTRTASPFTAGETCTVSFILANILDADNADTPDDLLAPSPLTYEFEIAPVAVNDAFTVTSHLEARFDTMAPGTTNILTNDLPTGSTVAAVEGAPGNVGVAITLLSGATLTVEADGDFNYVPPPGVGNGATDSFTYTLNAPNGSSATATVTITIDGPVIWYVDEDYTGPTYNGTAAFPFDDLTGTGNDFDGNAADAAGDFIFVYDSASNNSPIQCGLTLLDNQFVFGEGEPAGSFGTITGLTPVPETVTALPDTTGNAPQFSSTGDCFTLGAGNTIRGLDVNDTTNGAAFADSGVDIGTATITEVGVSGVGSIVEFLNGGTLTAQFNETSSTGSPSTKIHLVNIDGTMDSVGGTLDHAAAGTDAMIVSGGNIGGSMNASFNQTGGNALLNINGGHTGTWTFNATMTANTGSGMQFNNADGTYNITNTVTITNTSAGVNIENGSDGAVLMNSGASDIRDVQGIPFRVNGSTATVTYNGDITHRFPADITQRMIELINATGVMNFNGTYAAGDNANFPAQLHTAEGLYMEATGAALVTINSIDLTSSSTAALKGLTSGNIAITRARLRCDGDLTAGGDTHCIEFSDVTSSGVTIESLSVDTDDGIDNGGSISLVNTPGTWTVEAILTGVFTRLQPNVFGNNFGTLNISTVDSTGTPGGIAPGPFVGNDDPVFDLTNGDVNIDVTLMNAFNVPDHGVNLVNVGGTLFRNTGASTINNVAGGNELIFMDGVSTTDVFFSTDGTTANSVSLNQRRATAIYANNVTSTDVQFGNVGIANPFGVADAAVRILNSSAPFTFAATTIDQNNAGGVDEYATAPNQYPDDVNGVGDAISVESVTGALNINGGTLFNLADDGIDARDLATMTLDGLTINHGNNALSGKTAVQLYNSTLAVDPTYTLNNVTFQNYAQPNGAIFIEDARAVKLQQSTAAATNGVLTITNSTFNADTTPTTPADLSWGVFAVAENSGSLQMVVQGNTFSNHSSRDIYANLANSGNTLIYDVGSNIINGSTDPTTSSGIRLDAGSTGSSSLGFAIEDNTVTNANGLFGIAVNLNQGHDAGENAVNHLAFGLPLPYNSIRGNSITDSNSGLLVQIDETVHLDVEVSNNVTSNITTSSLDVVALAGHTGAAINEFVIANNTFGTSASPGGSLNTRFFGTGTHQVLLDNNQSYNVTTVPRGLFLEVDTATLDLSMRDNDIETTSTTSRAFEGFVGLSTSTGTLCADIGISPAGSNRFVNGGANDSRILNLSTLAEVEDQAAVPGANNFVPGIAFAATTSVAPNTCTEPVLN